MWLNLHKADLVKIIALEDVCVYWDFMLLWTKPRKVDHPPTFFGKITADPYVNLIEKLFTVHWTRQDTNFKQEKVGFLKAVYQLFLKSLSLIRLKDFPEKRVPTKIKYLPTVCKSLRKFVEGNAGKSTASFVNLT